MISWALSGQRQIKLTATSTFAWKHDEAAREEVRRDCRALAQALGGPITVTNDRGKWLAIVGMHGEELPGKLGEAHVDGDR